MDLSTRRLGGLSAVYLRLVLTALMWAGMFHVGQYVVAHMSPLAAAAWRFGLAALIFLPLVAWREGWSFEGLRRNALVLTIMEVVGVFGFNMGLFYGLQATSAVNGALIVGVNPALTSVQVVASTVTGGAVLMVVFASVVTTDLVQWPSWPMLAAIGFMGIFGSVLAYLWWNDGIKVIGLTQAAICMNFVPLFATLIGVLRGQHVGAAQWAGAALVVGCRPCGRRRPTWRQPARQAVPPGRSFARSDLPRGGGLLTR